MDDEHNTSEVDHSELGALEDTSTAPSTRKGFLKTAAVAGAGATTLSALVPAAALARERHRERDRHGRHHRHEQPEAPEAPEAPSGPTAGDMEIVAAAQIAEALAVTTYTNIINTSPFFPNIPTDDQGYLTAARQEEMSHYLLEESVTGKPTPFTTFYYPPNMFTDTQTTLNVLVTLEDAFIAAYLVGVRDFSTPDLKVLAARIMGIESDHRTLARVVGGDVAAVNGGPIEEITGFQKVAESIEPPNNNGYERTLLLTSISQAVEVLLPFAEKAAAQKAGFDVTKPYKFEPFTPTLPSPLGEFHSFAG
jgi:Ferritin-like domain